MGHLAVSVDWDSLGSEIKKAIVRRRQERAHEHNRKQSLKYIRYIKAQNFEPNVIAHYIQKHEQEYGA